MGNNSFRGISGAKQKNKMSRNILYISYDGLTDPVADSQVLPYMFELAKKGHHIHILSFEKQERAALVEGVAQKLALHGIVWTKAKYTKKPPVLSTVRDIYQGIKKARKIVKEHNINIIHARSYIAALMALSLKKTKSVPFIFDMRGFWVDERVDGGLWVLKNPLYYMVYKWFKKKEKRLWAESTHIVSLTHNAKGILESQFGIHAEKISVIPCAADYELFNPDNLFEASKVELRTELGIPYESFVLFYHGSLGTWYKGEEMLDFFEILLQSKPNAVFLMVVNDLPETLQASIQHRGLEKYVIIRKKLPRTELPLYISLADLCIMFIKPAFSKTASSPIKYVESLAMNKPVLANSGVGDMDELKNNNWGVLIQDFNKEEYAKASAAIDKLQNDEIRSQSKAAYLLAYGVEKYENIYFKNT